jgi:TrmH family RNA methyltransferase
MTKPETISSAANPLLKDVRRAVERGALTTAGYCVAESFHLLEEALRSGCEVAAVLAVEPVLDAAEKYARGLRGGRLLVLPEKLFAGLASTEASQGVIALVRPPAWTIDQLFGEPSLVLVLDGLQDPGNAGSAVRAAEALGATGVIFLKGTASPFNPKTLRASAGSLFRIPFGAGLENSVALEAMARHGVDLYAAVPAAVPNARSAPDSDLTRPCALVIGNEARGVSPGVRARAIELSIPTGPVESLNAAVAAGILLYEAWRQRSRQGPGAL